MSRCRMTKKPTTLRRDDVLSRDRIIEAAIELLDQSGESGLTFRSLAERLATGAGAIYWHVANKSDLLTAACDTLIARTVAQAVASASPQAQIRALALGMFDAMDAHPWVGAALMQAPGQLPSVRILESLGQPLCALGVPENAQWPTASALLHYILGVGGQNAANAQMAQANGLERARLLDSVANSWSQLNPAEFPFASRMAAALRTHDDQADFLAGVDLILAGVMALRGVAT